MREPNHVVKLKTERSTLCFSITVERPNSDHTLSLAGGAPTENTAKVKTT